MKYISILIIVLLCSCCCLALNVPIEKAKYNYYVNFNNIVKDLHVQNYPNTTFIGYSTLSFDHHRKLCYDRFK